MTLLFPPVRKESSFWPFLTPPHTHPLNMANGGPRQRVYLETHRRGGREGKPFLVKTLFLPHNNVLCLIAKLEVREEAGPSPAWRSHDR